MKKRFFIEVVIDTKVSFRDIERQLNVLDAETELLKVEGVENEEINWNSTKNKSTKRAV